MDGYLNAPIWQLLRPCGVERNTPCCISLSLLNEKDSAPMRSEQIMRQLTGVKRCEKIDEPYMFAIVFCFSLRAERRRQ